MLDLKIFFGICVLGLTFSQLVVAGVHPKIKAGVWGGEEKKYLLSLSQKEQLRQKLYFMTGWKTLKWGNEGQLLLEDSMIYEGGSEVARSLLQEVFACDRRFVIENHAESPSVNFGQIDEGTAYFDEETGRSLDIYRVRLDFADFVEMQAPPEVRQTFDPGFTLLHEILHGLGLKDAPTANEIGECEEIINKIRAELNLPLRDQYFGDVIPLSRQVKSVRLRFKKRMVNSVGRAIRWHHQYLYFLPGAESAAANALTEGSAASNE